MSENRQLRVEDIRLDGGTQPRAAIDEQAVKDYAEAMTEGATFPPLDVFFDGVKYWLADGFHRYHAAKRIGLVEIPCVQHSGVRRDAVLFSVGVNQGHGIRRTNADKRKAVMTLLNDEEWKGWSDREISRRCNVSNHFVAALRPQQASVTGTIPSEKPRTYTTKHGTEATMNVEKIGRAPSAKGQRRAELEAIVAAAVEGAAPTSLRRLPKRADADMVESAIASLKGIIGALDRIDLESVIEDERAISWRFEIDAIVGSLRKFGKQLPQVKAQGVAV